MKTLLAASLLALTACAARSTDTATSAAAIENTPNAPDAKFTWPVPEGGAPEEIAFPLPFAPELPYTGNLELRFQPHFFTPDAETYFSYSFAMLLDNAPSYTPARLSSDLVTYYAGLAKSSDADHFDPAAHHADFGTELKDGTVQGTIDTQDGFNEGRALHLNVLAKPIACGAKHGVLITLSPHPMTSDDAVWTKLMANRAQFSCSAS